jgi:hypothetical protein
MLTAPVTILGGGRRRKSSSLPFTGRVAERSEVGWG